MSSASTLVALDPCPGAGRCHGCMSWCDHCGHVGLVCDAAQGRCARHHCRSCLQLLGPDDYDGCDWWALCRSCSFAAVNDDALKMFERRLEEGRFATAEAIARDIDVNRGGEGTLGSAAELVWSLYRPIGGLLWRGVR